MSKLEAEEIIHIHNIVVKRFNISDGILNRGIIDSIVKKPDTQFGDDFHPYDDPFTKAATILESIIRWHPFADGNKRTALLATVYYLKLEGYATAIPLSAVRYTVQIAKNKNVDAKNTAKLIKEISQWLQNHSAKTKNEFLGKYFVHLLIPYSILQFLNKIGLRGYVYRKIGEWMAFDIYPEYYKEAEKIAQFIQDTLRESYTIFDESESKS